MWNGMWVTFVLLLVTVLAAMVLSVATSKESPLSKDLYRDSSLRFGEKRNPVHLIDWEEKILKSKINLSENGTPVRPR